MRVKIDVAGVRRTKVAVETRSAKVRLATRGGVHDWAEAAAGIMRDYVPVRTGDLRDAIRNEGVEKVPRGWAAFVGPGNRVRYAAFVEYGTNDTPEQPYARPTSRVARTLGPGIITRHVRRAV